MARILDRQKMIALRQEGKTYSEIRLELGIASSTLSDWLRNYPLTNEQLLRLETNRAKSNYLARERTSITKKLNLQKRLDQCYTEQKLSLLPLSKRELFLAGLFLYWGEGGKTQRGTVSMSNTDPAVIKFSLLWLREALEVPKESIQVLLHLYNDMDVATAIDYWSQTLFMPKNQFAKPYIKTSKKVDINYKGFGHGTCMLRVFNTVIKEKILMSIKAMADYSSHHIPKL